MSMKAIEETGNRYSRLVVLSRAKRPYGTGAWWLCLCDCGTETVVIGNRLRSGHTKSCGCLGPELSRARIGKLHHLWRGGIKMSTSGYRSILVDRDDPLYCMTDTKGYVPEHRLVLARHLGRPLLPFPQETVHHRNGDKLDNSPENLELRLGSHGIGATAPHCKTCTCQTEQTKPNGGYHAGLANKVKA